jgi:hypothetical protein
MLAGAIVDVEAILGRTEAGDVGPDAWTEVCRLTTRS